MIFAAENTDAQNGLKPCCHRRGLCSHELLSAPDAIRSSLNHYAFQEVVGGDRYHGWITTCVSGSGTWGHVPRLEIFATENTDAQKRRKTYCHRHGSFPHESLLAPDAIRIFLEPLCVSGSGTWGQVPRLENHMRFGKWYVGTRTTAGGILHERSSNYQFAKKQPIKNNPSTSDGI